MQTIYPTLEESLELYERLIRRFGGTLGVRDRGLLDAALHRPQSGYYPTLSMQAAALLHSLIHNHCFIDGNKRIAFALTAVFLKMNGYRLRVTAGDGESFVVNDVIKGRIELDAIASWLEAHMYG